MQEVARRVVEGHRHVLDACTGVGSSPAGPGSGSRPRAWPSRETDHGRALRIVGTVGRATERVEQEADRRRREFELTQAIRLSSIGEVASALGHELNQPLAAAMADVQSAQRLLRKAARRAKRPSGCRASLECIERAAAIVRQHRQAIRPPGEGGQRIDLRESADQICTMFEADTRRRGIAGGGSAPSALRGTREPRTARTDPRQSRPEWPRGRDGRGRPEAACHDYHAPHEDQRPAPRVRHGAGVAKDVQASLFMPYFTTKREGTGLGLSLSRSIAEAHRGRLVLESGRPGNDIPAGIAAAQPRQSAELESPRAQAIPDRVITARRVRPA